MKNPSDLKIGEKIRIHYRGPVPMNMTVTEVEPVFGFVRGHTDNGTEFAFFFKEVSSGLSWERIVGSTCRGRGCGDGYNPYAESDRGDGTHVCWGCKASGER